MKILLIEDDQPTSSALVELLTAQHYAVNLATDGQMGLELARDSAYDLILLGVVLPKLDGIRVCQQLRADGYQCPILLLSANASSGDRIIGLEAGADDYVVKPFDPPELIARIRALLRRERASADSVLTWETVQFDTVTSEVTCNGQPLRLTHKEYGLLELFLLNPKRIFSRSAILDRLWDFAEPPGEETVSTHIKCLRQKLKAAGASDLIETVYGLGYRLRTPAQAAEAPVLTPGKQKREAAVNQRAATTTARVWEKYRDNILAQVTVLETAARALTAGQLTPSQQQHAQQEAHKLAGSLGIFGFMAGSHLARELESLLQLEARLEAAQVQHVSQLVASLQQVLAQAQATATMPETNAYAPSLLIIDDDLLLAERVRIEAIAWGLRVELATDLAVARKAIAQVPPDAILLDLNFPGADNGFTLLRELMQRSPPIPVLAFTGQGDLASRLAVVRLGGCVFLQKPLPTYEILKAVTNVLRQTQVQHHNRVLVVDDDGAIAANLAHLLQPFGVEVTGLSDPHQFWEMLTATMPNLLLLDLEMPGFNGVDLCQAVRSDPKWQQLTILFLSTHTEAAIVDRAFTAGADDYLFKAMAATELATRIIHRLKRNGFQPTASPSSQLADKGQAT
ncbi:response regulator [Phormidium sp. FACHB-592]|uniref:Response regulator n=1 Tax=Stenomitos frigidus AS-A4 TaxID=2933935 RepID=A0ABV0KM95_9CYAN|nr:response regulator [Phormidium sp. FACHB-592]MBD2072712.1 response regulator [Phormidium sp. FACHB-592]